MISISVSKVIGTIVALVGIGLLLGLGWMDSDWAHPIKSIAEYQRNVWQGEIDREEYRKLQEAQTRAVIQKTQDEIEHANRLQEEELRRIQADNALKARLFEFAGVVAIVVAGLILLILAIGLDVSIARRPDPVCKEIWTDTYKRQIIEATRRREREEREAALRTRPSREPNMLQPDLVVQGRWRDMFSEPIGSNGGENAAVKFN